ncbi:hypothetical protein ACNVED_07540 [Legionella sp. D16C41]|uniref:hypothetical protein n=1 Tax=Legionella sp. D16C41 TaxID=3402688 RepID=UPI003AF75F35
MKDLKHSNLDPNNNCSDNNNSVFDPNGNEVKKVETLPGQGQNDNGLKSTRKQHEHYYTPQKLIGFLYRISYVLLDEKGTVLMAGHAKGDNKDELFLQEGLSKSTSITKSTHTDANGNAQNNTNSSLRSQPYTHPYVVYNGVLKINGQAKNIQVIFITQPNGKLQSGDHNAINTSVRSVVENRHRLAVAPGKTEEAYINIDKNQMEYEVVVTPDLCLFGNNDIILETTKGHYFCGECKSNLTTDDMQDMIGHPLRDIVFNTKGTYTTAFKNVALTELADKPTLESFIPEKCMDFHLTPLNASKGSTYDDNLMKTINTPERRDTYRQNLFTRIGHNKSINDAHNPREVTFFKREPAKKVLRVVELDNVAELNNDNNDTNRNSLSDNNNDTIKSTFR